MAVAWVAVVGWHGWRCFGGMGGVGGVRACQLTLPAARSFIWAFPNNLRLEANLNSGDYF